MHCLDCDYALNHLTSNRCPECGRLFDPNDPTTFRPLNEQERKNAAAREIKGTAIAVGLALAIAFAGLCVTLFGNYQTGFCCSGCYFFFALAGAGYGLIRIQRIRRGFRNDDHYA